MGGGPCFEVGWDCGGTHAETACGRMPQLRWDYDGLRKDMELRAGRMRSRRKEGKMPMRRGAAMRMEAASF